MKETAAIAPRPIGRRPLAVDSLPSTTAVAHPTTRWSSDPNLTAIEVAPAPRRVVRPARPTARLPWVHLTISFAVLATLIAMVLCEKAQLISAQYTLVDLRTTRTRELKLRDELKLQIQRLTSLDRVDSLSRSQLRMCQPVARQVLDLQRTATTHPTQTLARRTHGGGGERL